MRNPIHSLLLLAGLSSFGMIAIAARLMDDDWLSACGAFVGLVAVLAVVLAVCVVRLRDGARSAKPQEGLDFWKKETENWYRFGGDGY